MRYSVVFVRLSNKHHSDPFPTDNVPPFDLMQTQEILEKKHNIYSLLIDGQIYPQKIPALVKRSLSCVPQVIILSCLSIKIFECLEFFKRVKQADPNIITIAVGQLATYCTERICNPDSPVDFVIRGEFQVILADFLSQIVSLEFNCRNFKGDDAIFSRKSEKLSQLHVIDNYDDLPQVRYTKKMLSLYSNLIPLPVFKRIIWGRVFTSYGCPNSCIYCSPAIRLSYGQNYRRRSVCRIMDEIKYLKSIRANVIEFSDDNFSASEDHLLSVCQAIIKNELRIKWGTHIRIDDVSERCLSVMKQAGCFFIRCGIESGSEAVLSRIGKTKDPEGWIKKAKETFKLCKKFNITTIANIMLGSPKEERQDVKKTKDLLFSLEPDIVQVHYCCPYPGSTAYAQLTSKPSDKELAQMHHHSACPENNSDWLRLEQKQLIANFYFRPRYILRHIAKFGPYYALNIAKFWVIVKSLFKIIFTFKDKGYSRAFSLNS